MLGLFPCGERAEVSALARLWIDLSRVDPVVARLELSDHGPSANPAPGRLDPLRLRDVSTFRPSEAPADRRSAVGLVGGTAVAFACPHDAGLPSRVGAVLESRDALALGAVDA